MEALQWAIGILVTILTVVIGFLASALWAHVTRVNEMNARLEGVARDMERAKVDIGTHDAGIRGAVHRHAGILLEHELRLTMLEKKP